MMTDLADARAGDPVTRCRPRPPEGMGRLPAIGSARPDLRHQLNNMPVGDENPVPVAVLAQFDSTRVVASTLH